MTKLEKTINGRLWHIWQWSSVPEILDNARRGKVSEPNKDHYSVESLISKNGTPPEPSRWRKDWRGGTWEYAQTFGNWNEGRRLFNKASSKLPTDSIEAPQSIRRVRRWSDMGDEFNRDRFFAGHYDTPWESRKRARTVGSSILSITVDLSQSCGKTAEQLIYSGLAAVKLTDLLEQAGYRCDLTACYPVKRIQENGGSVNMLEMITVKHAEQACNVDALLIAIAHPLMFRYAVFCTFLQLPFKASGNFGYPTETPEQYQGDIHIPACDDLKSAIRAIKAGLKQVER